MFHFETCYTLIIKNVGGKNMVKSIEKEITAYAETLAEHFFTYETWLRKDVSTQTAIKDYDIPKSRVFRLLKALKVNYLDKPYSDGMSLEERTNYLLDNLKLSELIKFYNWYLYLSKTPAPKKAKYRYSSESKEKRITKLVEANAKAQRIMKQINSLTDLSQAPEIDSNGINLSSIPVTERARIANLSTSQLALEIATAVKEIKSTPKQKAKFITGLTSKEKIALYLSHTGVNGEFKTLALKIYIYLDIRKDVVKKVFPENNATIFEKSYGKVSKMSIERLRNLAEEKK